VGVSSEVETSLLLPIKADDMPFSYDATQLNTSVSSKGNS